MARTLGDRRLLRHRRPICSLTLMATTSMTRWPSTPIRSTSDSIRDRRSVQFNIGGREHAARSPRWAPWRDAREGGCYSLASEPSARFGLCGCRGCAKREDRGKTNAVFVSPLASYRLHGIERFGYLRDLFILLPSWPRPRVLELASATGSRPSSRSKLSRSWTPTSFAASRWGSRRSEPRFAIAAHEIHQRGVPS